MKLSCGIRKKNARIPTVHSAGEQNANLADNAHWLDVNAVAHELKTARPDGLREDEASRRLEV